MTKVHSGKFYGRKPSGELVEVVPPAGADPDAWICRRVVDFPGAIVPAGAAVSICSRCEAPIVFNPARRVTAPKVCFQCADVVPLPIPEES
jgi:hypothetical protein